MFTGRYLSFGIGMGLLGVGFAAGTVAHGALLAQQSSTSVQLDDPSNGNQPTIRTNNFVRSGGDVGVRITGFDANGNAIGSVVVKENGRWVDVRNPVGFHPAR